MDPLFQTERSVLFFLSMHRMIGVIELIVIVPKKRLVLGILLILLVGVLCRTGFQADKQATQTLAVPVANHVVVIDPGHGGFDAGASANGVVEKELNLAVALYLKQYIEQSGGIAVLTRNEDVSTADPEKSGISAKKSDLLARKALPASVGADVFVSIHGNKFPQTQYRGAQVFYSESPEDGKRLGEKIQQGLVEILQDGNVRKAKKIDGGVFILKNTSVPSVVVECGFLSNPQEAELLKQEEYHKKLAWGIYLGLTRYFND